MPRHIWVIEAIDRVEREKAVKNQGARDRSVECVMGEVILDATSDELRPDVLAVRLPGLLSMPQPWDPDWDVECSDALLSSGGQSYP